MLTPNQLSKGARHSYKKYYTRSTALMGRPQAKAFVLKVLVIKPKKPNSAFRKIVKLRLLSRSSRQSVRAHIPGEGHNLKEHSVVLIRGGRTKDLPGVNYKVVRAKLDCLPVVSRTRSRSKFGVKRGPSQQKGHY